MSSRRRAMWRKRLVGRGLETVARLANGVFAKKLVHRVLVRTRVERGRPAFDSSEWRFLARVVLQKERSRAQIFQDLWVLHELEDRRGGFFVEFGAADGEYLSNTWLLEKEYGWQGILAEPAPSWHEALRRNRSAEISTACVHARSGERIRLHIPKTSAEYSTTIADPMRSAHQKEFQDYDTIEVDTISLNDLLATHNAPGEINYISMDVEGAELDILKTFDFSRYRVELWSIEHNDPARAAQMDEIMLAHGYRRCFPEFSMFDAWYRLVDQ